MPRQTWTARHEGSDQVRAERKHLMGSTQSPSLSLATAASSPLASALLGPTRAHLPKVHGRNKQCGIATPGLCGCKEAMVFERSSDRPVEAFTVPTQTHAHTHTYWYQQGRDKGTGGAGEAAAAGACDRLCSPGAGVRCTTHGRADEMRERSMLRPPTAFRGATPTGFLPPRAGSGRRGRDECPRRGGVCSGGVIDVCGQQPPTVERLGVPLLLLLLLLAGRIPIIRREASKRHSRP